MTTHIPNESLGSLGLSWHRASRRPTSGTTCESKEHARDSLSSLAAMLEDDIAKLDDFRHLLHCMVVAGIPDTYSQFVEYCEPHLQRYRSLNVVSGGRDVTPVSTLFYSACLSLIENSDTPHDQDMIAALHALCARAPPPLRTLNAKCKRLFVAARIGVDFQADVRAADAPLRGETSDAEPRGDARVEYFATPSDGQKVVWRWRYVDGSDDPRTHTHAWPDDPEFAAAAHDAATCDGPCPPPSRPPDSPGPT